MDLKSLALKTLKVRLEKLRYKTIFYQKPTKEPSDVSEAIKNIAIIQHEKSLHAEMPKCQKK